MRRSALRPALRRIAVPTIAATVASLASIVLLSPSAHATGQAATSAVGSAYALGQNSGGELGLNGQPNPHSAGAPVVDAGGNPIPGVIQAAVGQHVSVLLTSSGTVYAAGDNTGGGLGTGTGVTTQDYFAPVTILGGLQVTKVIAGGSMIMILTANGNTYAWGKLPDRPGNTSNIVNFAEEEDHYLPVGVTPIDIATDGDDMYTLGDNGRVYAVGVNTYGQLGNGTTTPMDTANPAASTVIGVTNGFAITAGGGHALVAQTITGSNTITFLGWGGNTIHQLDPSASIAITAAESVGPTTNFFSGFAAGGDFNIIAQSNARPYIWGSLDGSGTYTPTQLVTDPNGVLTNGLLSVSIGMLSDGVAAVTRDHRLVGWNGSAQGETGNTSAVPAYATSSKFQSNVVDVAEGQFINSIVLSANATNGTIGGAGLRAPKPSGLIYGFGYNSSGQLGAAQPDPQPTPAQLTDLPPDNNDQGWFDVAGGEGGGGQTNHLIALDNTGKVWGMGLNDRGQATGNSSDGASFSTKHAITGLPAGLRMISLSANILTSAALDEFGHVWGWGQDPFTGNVGHSAREYLLPGDQRVVQLSAGGDFYIALTSTGQVYTMGSNGTGQIGNGAMGGFVPTWYHVQFPGKVTMVQAGMDSSEAVVQSGANNVLYTWGRNDNNQLGRITPAGDPVTPSLPAPSATPTQNFSYAGKILQISISTKNALVLLDNGQVMDFGNVGGGVSDQPTPVNITTNGFDTNHLLTPGTVASVSAGNGDQMVLFKNGTVASWGAATPANGQNSAAVTAHPTLIPGLSLVAYLPRGFGETVLIKTHGGLRASVPSTFGDIPTTGPGSTQTQVVKIADNTDDDLDVLNVSISGPDADEYSTDFNGASTCGDVPLKFAVSPHIDINIPNNCILNVTFAPTRPGTSHATLNVTSNAERPAGVTVAVPVRTEAALNGVAHLLVSGIQNVSVNPDHTTTPMTATNIPIASLPLSLLPDSLPATVDAPAGKTPAGKTPAGKTDFSKTPAGKTPAGKTPAGKTPAGKTGLGLIPAGKTPAGKTPAGKTPAGKTPLSQVTLDQIPLFRQGGWAAVLACYPSLANQTPNLVSYSAAYAADNGTGPLKGTVPDVNNPAACDSPITADQIDWAHSPFADISLLSILMGDVRMDQYPVDWCSELPLIGAGTCTDDGGLGNRDLMELEYLYTTLDRTTVANATIGQITNDASSGGNPLGRAVFPGLDLVDANVATTAFGTIPLSAVPNAANVVTCDITQPSCINMTLGDAASQTPSALKTTATFADLGSAMNNMRLLDLVESFVDPSSLDWEDLDLTKIDPTQISSAATSTVEYTTTFDIQCANTPGLAVTMGYPQSFVLKTNGAVAYNTVGGNPSGAPLTVGAPTPATGPNPSLTYYKFPIDGTGIDCSSGAGHVQFSSDVFPGYLTGSYVATADVTDGSGDDAPDPAPSVTVQDTSEPGNDSPSTAPTIDSDSLVVGQISSTTDLDYFKVTIPAGKDVEVTMKPPAGHDYDLAVYDPVGSTSAIALRSTAPFAVPFGQQEYADPSRESDTQKAADAVLQDVPLLQDRPIAAVSAIRSSETETVSFTAPQGSDRTFIVQVSGYLGNNSTASYTLRVRTSDDTNLPSCSSKSYPNVGTQATNLVLSATGGAGALTGNEDTLFLVDKERLEEVYGATQAANIIAAVNHLAHPNDSTVPVNGAVLEVDANAAVHAATVAADTNPCNPGAQDTTVRAINDAVDSVLTAPGRLKLQNVVIVGTDEIIPFGRIEDRVANGNERDFTGDALFDGNNSLAGADAAGYFLSDDPYGSLNPIGLAGRTLYLPQVALGRLGETPAAIISQVNQFITFKGIADPRTTAAAPLAPVTGARTGLVTDYDFLSDSGQAEATSLGAQLGGTNVLHLTGSGWTRQQLIADFTAASPVPAITALNAHYDQYRAVPGDQVDGTLTDPFTTADVPTANGAMARRIVYTLGCHSGLNVPDDYGLTLTGANAQRLQDWAQTYGNAGTAVMIGNLGYGYGDTVANAYSEKLFTNFTNLLNGDYTVGGAMLQAKRQYLLGLQAYAPYDEKVLQETVLWGLPMYRVINKNPITPPTAQVIPDNIDTQTGLATDTVQVTSPVTKVNDGNGFSHFVSTAGVQATNGYPLIPIATTPLRQINGKFAHSIVPVALTSNAQTIKNTFAQATTDNTIIGAQPYDDTTFPVALGALQSVANPDGTLTQTLVSAQGQFRSDGTDTTVEQQGIFRTFSSSTWTAYYSSSSSTIQPSFSQATNVNTGGVTTIAATIATNGGGSIKRVYALARVAGQETWTLVEMHPQAGQPGVWSGSTTSLIDEYVAFAINSDGNAGQIYQLGAYSSIVTSAPAPDDIEPATTTTPTGTNGYFNSNATVGIAGAPAPGYKLSVDGGAAQTAPVTITAEGTHSVRVIDPNGNPVGQALPVKIDKTPPTVNVTVPVVNGIYKLNQPVTGAYTAADTGGSGLHGTVDTGIPTTSGHPGKIDTSSIGVHTYTVYADDNAGNTTTKVISYRVVYGSVVGPLSPVVTAGNSVNITTSLAPIPMNYKVYDYNGVLVPNAINGNSYAFNVEACPLFPTNVQLNLSPLLAPSDPVPSYNAATGTYTWKIKPLNGIQVPVLFCQRIIITLNDGYTQLNGLFRVVL